MPCTSQATRMRTTCRPSPIAAKWSAEQSMITWYEIVSLAPITCSTWLGPTSQPRANSSEWTAWPLCPSPRSRTEIPDLTPTLLWTASRNIFHNRQRDRKSCTMRSLSFCVYLSLMWGLHPLDKAHVMALTIQFFLENKVWSGPIFSALLDVDRGLFVALRVYKSLK